MKKNLIQHTRISFFIIVGSLLLYTVLFFTLQPGMASRFSWYREHRLESFLETIKQENAVTPKSYWQFREFYSRGDISYDTDVIAFDETQRIYNLPSEKSLLLHFEAPHLQSDDYLIKKDASLSQQDQIARILAEEEVKPETSEIIFSDDRTRVIETDAMVFIVFVKTIEEMREANGLSDYIDAEQKLLEDTFWLNVTKIQK